MNDPLISLMIFFVLGGMLLIAAIAIFVFYREFLLWFRGVNKVTNRMDEQIRLQREIARLQSLLAEKK